MALATVQERNTSEVVEILWNVLPLVEKDQLQNVSDAGLWVSCGLSVGENRSGSVWTEERFCR